MRRTTDLRRALAALALPLVLGACTAAEDEPAAPTLAELQSEIFGPSCGYGACHAGAAPAESLDLSSEAATRAAVVGVSSTQSFNGETLLRVLPGDASASYLFLKIEGTTGIQGTRMPQGVAPLTSEQRDRIARWIDAGAD